MNMHELSERQNEAKSDKGCLLTIHPSVKSMPNSVLSLYSGINRSILSLNRENTIAHEMHVRQSKQNILATALVGLENAPEENPKKALLLGVGNCLDIPLEELAKRFNSLTLVEMDQESVENAVKKLPKELWHKINIEIADISGITAILVKGVVSAAKTISVQDFYSEAANAIRKAKIDMSKNIPDFGKDYSFVSSQLLISQLIYTPHRFIEILARKNYSATLSTTSHLGPKPVVDHELFWEFQRFSRKIIETHLNLLKKSSLPTSTIHLADTVIGRQFRPNSIESPKEYPLLPIEEFNTLTSCRFDTIREPETWLWEHTPVVKGKGGEHFVVRSNALRPKI